MLSLLLVPLCGWHFHNLVPQGRKTVLYKQGSTLHSLPWRVTDIELPFLDIQIYWRSGSSWGLKVYRKLAHTNLYLSARYHNQQICCAVHLNHLQPVASRLKHTLYNLPKRQIQVHTYPYAINPSQPKMRPQQDFHGGVSSVLRSIQWPRLAVIRYILPPLQMWKMCVGLTICSNKTRTEEHHSISNCTYQKRGQQQNTALTLAIGFCSTTLVTQAESLGSWTIS
jgi:hypothetical protein